ncbi:MAG: DUF1080 domain-containing protein [Verrucomicrobiota bacterium]
MNFTPSILPVALLLALSAFSVAAATPPIRGEQVIIDFEGANPVAGNHLTHDATTTAVNDVPQGGGKTAAKTVVVPNAGARSFFGTGFTFPAKDLAGVGEIRFWLKTDAETSFNFQVHTQSRASIHPVSTLGLEPNTWHEFTVPVEGFTKPPWAPQEADWSKIDKIQVTAFGNGPYDGKTILLDQVVNKGVRSAATNPIIAKKPRPLREPVILSRSEPVDMFDGESLDGWFAIPRVYIRKNQQFARIPSNELFDAVIEHYEESDGQINGIPDRERVKNKGVWKVEDGSIIGGQVPETIAGAYLMSEKTYGDFELTLEANPDYPIDTGIMVRAHKLGSVGFQVLIDNRPNGTIGGVFGNSVGSFFAYPFVFDADEAGDFKIANLRPGDPNALKFPGGQFQTDRAATLEEFLEAWNPNDWNEIKIRCTGRMPLIETWINGVPIAKIDTATLADRVPNYDPDDIFERIGRKGHIGLEVHDSPTPDRWAPGAQARWRNIRITELEIKKPVENRGGPILLDEPETPTMAKTPPKGFRSLFDGNSLEGWTAMPRLPVPAYPSAPFKMRLQGEALEKARANVGKWTVEDGMIIGGQDPPGSGRGAYLVTEEKFGDFELMMDMKPDWKVDSGFLVRTLPEGSPGMQVLVDHRPQGGIGGFYGNGLAGIHAMPFAIDAEYDDEGNPIGLIAAQPDPEKAELDSKTRGILQYAADVDDFLEAWKWGQWNTVKVRCEGRIPTLTTWVNGTMISVLEMSTVDWENYDAEACAEFLGSKGHISLEVHNSNLNHWLGKARWWPGAVVRWKNIFIRELD